MYESLLRVSRRFPQLRDLLARHWACNQDFRDLCDDYEACEQRVAQLSTGEPSLRDIRDEYAALLLRLEREMLRHLEEHAVGMPSTSREGRPA